MDPDFLDSDHCPVFQGSIEFLGRRWTASILRPMFHGPVRFTDLLETVPRLSARLLSQRLDELAEAGYVVRTSCDDHHAYQLTDKGRDLAPVFASMHAWATRWLDAEPS